MHAQANSTKNTIKKPMLENKIYLRLKSCKHFCCSIKFGKIKLKV